MEMKFDWNPTKAKDNVIKHGVSFGEAATAFRDPFSSLIPDTVHSATEERSLLLGLSKRRRLLVIVHVDRGEIVRIISARLATANEKRNYEEDQL